MSRKERVVEALRERGIDPVALEKELLAMLRRGASSLDVESYLKRVIEGDGK